MWAAALELCEIVVGGPMAEGEAPEYVLADLLSGLPAGGAGAGWSSVHPCSVPLVSRVPQSLWVGRGPLPVARLARELGSRVLSESEHRRIEQLLELVEADEAQGSADPFAIDRRLRALVAARSELELDLARLLRLFRSFNLSRHVGFDGFKDYVGERLGISAARADFLVRLDFRLAEFREVAGAVRRGEIGTVAALLVCRVARRDSTERAWIERARRRTVLRLRKEVEWAERERGKTWHGEVLPPAPGRLPSELDAVTEEILAGLRSDASSGAAATGDEAGSAGAEACAETFAHGAERVGPETFARGARWGRPWRVEFRLRQSGGRPL
jgi:hypothetical protein